MPIIYIYMKSYFPECRKHQSKNRACGANAKFRDYAGKRAVHEYLYISVATEGGHNR